MLQHQPGFRRLILIGTPVSTGILLLNGVHRVAANISRMGAFLFTTSDIMY
jgi:hypothetical protein